MSKRFFLILLFMGSALRAEVSITITGANIKRARIAVGDVKPLGQVDAQLAALLSNQLKEDLELLNLFDFVDHSLFAALDVGTDIQAIRYADWTLLGASFVLKTGYRTLPGKVVLEATFQDIPGEKRLFSKIYQFPSDQWVRMVHALSEEILRSITGEEGLFSTKILMACSDKRKLAGAREIYVSDPDGRNVLQLTKDGTLSLSPTWAPDGKQIAYMQYEVRLVGRKRQKVQALKSHELKTGRRVVLSARKGVNSGASWSPDGKTIAATLSFTGRPEIYFFDPTNPNKEPVPLSRAIQWRKISGAGFMTESPNNLLDVEPDWSPDGKRIVLSSARTGHPMIYIVDLATKQASQLTFAGTYNASPAWSPLGDKIIFAAQRLAEGNFDLYSIDPDGNNLARLTEGTSNGRKVNSENPSWAPTGRHLAFAANEDGHYGIYLMTTDGRVRRKISPEGKDCKNPAWGPK